MDEIYELKEEIERIRDIVKEKIKGEVRLKWWSDIINGEERGSDEENKVEEELIEKIEK